MESASGNSNNGGKTMYERQRDENIAENNQKLVSLGLTPISTCNESRKKAKRTHNPSVQATRTHNLRPRPHVSHAMNVNGLLEEDVDEEDVAEEDVAEEDDWEFESVGDFLCDNEDCHRNTQEKRNGRGISKLNDVFARKPGMPKIKVMVNEHGQPIGENARRFSGAIGVHVRQNISIACTDWRLVDEKLKDAVWSSMQQYFDIDDNAKAKDWVLGAAAKKWKDFKVDLKKKFFKGEMTEEILKKKQGKRLNDDDWDYLKKHWSSPEAEAQSKIAKANRAMLSIHHTTGSKSFACNGYEMANELGRPPRRDELYVKTHTPKNGIPSSNAAPIIDKLKSIIEAQPELIEKSIQQGDAFAAVCGQKEPKGRVRCLGLGPTPQTIGTPGAKRYTPTRVQMQLQELKRQESQRRALEERIAELEAELAHERLAHENVSQNGSNSRHHESPRSEANYVETNHVAELHEDGAYANNSNEYEYVLVPRAPHVQQPHRSSSFPVVQPSTFPTASSMQRPHSSPIPTTTVQPPQSSPIPTTTVQPPQSSPIPIDPAVQFPQSSPNGAGPTRNGDANHISHDDLIGKEIVLYALQRDEPVAKGVVISVNPSIVHAGQALGKKHCLVVVRFVLKRDAKLPRPYPGVEGMADAKDMGIAWPYKRLKVCKTKEASCKTKKTTHDSAAGRST